MPTKRKRSKGPGAPRAVLTARDLQQLEIMAGLGLTWGQIGAILGVPKDTLRKIRNRDLKVAAAFERGKAVAELNVGKALYKRALTGDVPAIRWYEMTRANRRDAHSVAGERVPTGEDGEATYRPIEIRVVDPR